MTDLNKLRDQQNQETSLLAELAGLLHNIGKLDPNFIAGPTAGQSSVNIENLDISGYQFDCFAHTNLGLLADQVLRDFLAPELLDEAKLEQWLSQKFSPKMSDALKQYHALRYRHGPLYFANKHDRSQIKRQMQPEQVTQVIENRIQAELPVWQQKYGDTAQQLADRRRDEWIDEWVENLHAQLEQVFQAEKQAEIEQIKSWRNLLLTIESIQWPLPDFLSLFWDTFFVLDESQGPFQPGSDDDPDYSRKSLLEPFLKSHFDTDLTALLILAHGEISGQEKKGYTPTGEYASNKIIQSQSSFANLRLSTAFGYEVSQELNWQNWPEQRREIVDRVSSVWRQPQQQRGDFFKVLSKHLKKGLADTQYPINEISLWDYSHSIAGLFKTGVSQAIVTGQMPTPANMKWRLANIRFNGLDFTFQANQISDLIVRQKLFKHACDIVKQSLEIDLPIGTSIYADQHGLVFIMPELPGWNDDNIKKAIDDVVQQALRASQQKGENEQLNQGLYDITFEVRIYEAQRGKKLNLGQLLLDIPDGMPLKYPSISLFNKWWHDSEQLCTVCQQRPIGYIESGLPNFVTSNKAKKRNVCGICLARRGRRSRDWVNEKSNGTIWIDEVADTNGRIALISGQLELQDWLTGDLVRTLAIGQTDENEWLAKPPTFARIQRTWRTTHDFWQQIQQDTYSTQLSDNRRRLYIYLDKQPDLGDYHAYELELGKTTLSVVWYPHQDDKSGGYLISADNLGYSAKLLGADKEIWQSPAASALFVEDHIKETFIQQPKQPVLRDPEDNIDKRRNLIKNHRIKNTVHQDEPYSTAIPILAEPRTFMALVPADRAVEVINAIRKKYEREMGKVRNRLSLHLGAVYFQRRTPLRAALETGRKMLERNVAHSEGWTVKNKPSKKAKADWDEATRALADGTQQFDEWYAIELEQENGGRLIWRVPAVMGDGTTEDNWYPYVIGHKPGNGNQPFEQRNRAFKEPDTLKHETGEQNGPCWLVHAGDLQADDEVYFTPATFDFEFLDTAGRRFEIAYGEDGQRLNPEKAHRPYLLDELPIIQEAWDILSKDLTNSQIYAMRDDIEAKRVDWQPGKNDETFRQFCRDVIANAQWNIDKRTLDKLTNWAIGGLLADVCELYLSIMKEKSKRTQDEEQSNNV